MDLVGSNLGSVATTNKSINALPHNIATIPLLFHATDSAVPLGHGELFSRFSAINSMLVFPPELYQCARILGEEWFLFSTSKMLFNMLPVTMSATLNNKGSLNGSTKSSNVGVHALVVIC
mmetsp:Transcript_41254/g.119466  ORF Transcript_41254/g.119466 Transcript_41254/m.119466 type:complete len:120 (+) Transcript_41254:276-635(+)